jgi:diaminopimelate epimerase
MGAMGVPIEVHHHEVATGPARTRHQVLPAGQARRLGPDLKYVIHNVAQAYGKTATFMPKPIVGDNGSGMHCHQSIWKDGKQPLRRRQYAGLSMDALYYIGGIIKHAKRPQRLHQPDDQLVQAAGARLRGAGLLAYSARNRSASMPHPLRGISPRRSKRIEVRFPDPLANPYLGFAAMLMAGLDGVKNKIHPGEAMDKDLYDLPPEEELKMIPTVRLAPRWRWNRWTRTASFLTRRRVLRQRPDRRAFMTTLHRAQDDGSHRSPRHPAPGRDYEMYYNAVRCIGKYVHDRGLTAKTRVTLATRGGIKTLELQLQGGSVEQVTVDLGEPALSPASLPVTLAGAQVLNHPLSIDGQTHHISCVSMGNPHAVIFVDDPQAVDVHGIGRQIEHHPLFPKRTNVEFVRVRRRDLLEMRVWERGSGETLACGTGAAASLVAAVLNGLADRSAVVKLTGGELHVHWDARDNHVYQTGPATFVFDGVWLGA